MFSCEWQITYDLIVVFFRKKNPLLLRAARNKVEYAHFGAEDERSIFVHVGGVGSEYAQLDPAIPSLGLCFRKFAALK
jgi:hypothetical protein